MYILIDQVADENLPVMVEIAVSAFHDDDQYKPYGVSTDGPPGHDAFEVHQRWKQEMNYLKISLNNEIAGGICYELKDEEGEIAALFIHPDFMNQGLGTQLIHYVLKKHSSIQSWWLETPDYAKRNHQFYKKNGFKMIQRTPKEPTLGFGFIIYKIFSNPFTK